MKTMYGRHAVVTKANYWNINCENIGDGKNARINDAGNWLYFSTDSLHTYARANPHLHNVVVNSF